MKHLLVIDDEIGSRESIKAVFHNLYEVVTAENPRAALPILSSRPIDLVLLDLIMPEQDGISFLREIREIHPDLPVIMVSALTSEKNVREALRLGASGYVGKPFDVAELRHAVDQALNAHRAVRQDEILQKEGLRELSLHSVIGESALYRHAVEEGRRAAGSAEALLIYGEAGTGKEFFARQIHAWGPRSMEPFIAVKCAGQPAAVLETEIFGVSFRQDRPGENGRLGAFDLAGSGVVFLDEIERLPAVVQDQLIHVLKEGRFQRVGSSKPVPTAARIVVASTMDPEELVKSGGVRADFVAAIGKTALRLPALRERPEDIPLLAYYFVNQLGQGPNRGAKDIDPPVMNLMRQYDWPGNIRELRNVLERLLVVCRGEKMIRAEFLPREFATSGSRDGAAGKVDFTAAVDAFEREMIINALTQCNGSIGKTAEMLGITRRILVYRIDRLNIRKAAV